MKRFILLMSAIITSILLISYVGIRYSDSSVISGASMVNDFNTGWDIHWGHQSEHNDTLPTQLNCKANTVITLSNTLPNTIDSNYRYLCFRTYNQAVKVYINDKLIYEFATSPDRITGKIPGTTWHIVELPLDSSNQTITMEQSSPYHSFSKSISGRSIGTRSAILYYIFRANVSSFLICILGLLLGVFSFVCYFILRTKQEKNDGLLYLGFYMLLITIWFICETSLLDLCLGTPASIQMLSIACLALSLIPLGYCIYETYNFHYKSFFTCFVILAEVNFVFLNVMHFVFHIDYVQTLWSTHVTILFGLIGLTIICLLENLLYKNPSVNLLCASGIFCTFLLIYDFFRYYSSEYYDQYYSARYGILIFGFVSIIANIRKLLYNIKQRTETESLRKIAYMDIQTNLYNRASFHEDLKELNSHSSLYPTLCIIVFDLNNLKVTNDQLGHQTGDLLIAKTAQLIRTIFLKYGKCYRIGGDEFVVILKETNPDSIHVLTDRFLHQLQGQEQNSSNPLISIAMGYAIYDHNIDQTITDTFNRADHSMYENKATSKISNHS